MALDWIEKIDPIATVLAGITGIGAYFNLKSDTKRAIFLVGQNKEEIDAHLLGTERRRRDFSDLDKKVSNIELTMKGQAGDIRRMRRSNAQNSEQTKSQLAAINLKLALLLQDKGIREDAKTGTSVRSIPD